MPNPSHHPLPRRLGIWSLAALSLLLVAWSLWFVFQTSFLVASKRYFCLFDDSMISMDYARNLVEGHGLRWGLYGDPVEGFTTPLWTFLMIPWNAVGLPLRFRSLGVQLTSLLLLVANLWLFARLARRHFSLPEARVTLPATFLLVSFYPLNYWSLMGTESALQALLVTLTVLLALDIQDQENPRLGLLAVFGIAYLVRMDMLIMAVGTCAYLVLTGNRRELRANVRRGDLVLFGVVVGGYQVFRLWYFRDVLPNTYYLKLTGIPLQVRLERGLSKFVDFVWANPALLLVLIAVVLLHRWRASSKWRLSAVLVGLYFAYSIWVGGDAWEMHNNVRANRFVVFVLPLLFLPWNLAMCHLMARGRARVWRRVGAVALTACFALLLNGLLLSPQREANLKNLLVSEKPLLVTSHALVLQNVCRFEQLVAPGALVVTYWAGIPAYFSDYRLVDAFGYNNRYVARLPAGIRTGANGRRDYTPGHTKWDGDFLLHTVRPDAFFQAWRLSPEALRRSGYESRGEFWLRSDSPYLKTRDHTEGSHQDGSPAALRRGR
jgi:arabinofuranosyltransferase